MLDFFKRAKEASSIIATMPSATKVKVLKEFSKALLDNSQTIQEENKKDLEYATKNNLSSAMIDRLLLDQKRIEAMATPIGTDTLWIVIPLSTLQPSKTLPTGSFKSAISSIEVAIASILF